MPYDSDTTWSSSLLTASSFLGLVVSIVFGWIASPIGGGEFECVALGSVCATSFVAHLRIA